MCHSSSGTPSAFATSIASIVLPVPGSPFTSSGRCSVIAALTASVRSSVETYSAEPVKRIERLSGKGRIIVEGIALFGYTSASHFDPTSMLLRISFVLALFWTHAAIAQQPAPAGDAKAAHKKVQMCEGCHGIAGYRTAYPDVYSVPKLGGQQPTYLVRAMQAYKSGE